MPAKPKPKVLDFDWVPMSRTPSGTPYPNYERAKIPGGWLVIVGGGVCFVPDPQHKWDGLSLP